MHIKTYKVSDYLYIPQCICVWTLCALIGLFPSLLFAQEEILIEAVVASVSGKPITLQDLNSRFQPARALTLKEASTDPEAKRLLESLVIDRLVEEDSAAKHIGASDSEINSYIQEVAQQNGLTAETFEQAIAKEGRTLQDYKQRIQNDILRSKIIGQHIQPGITITDEEIDTFLKENASAEHSGAKVELAQIFVSFTSGEQAAQSKIDQIQTRLGQGDDFAALAKEFSESPDGREGGALGILAERDLSPGISAAFPGLPPGAVSPVVKSDTGIRIFKVLGYHDSAGNEPNATARDEARVLLRRTKLSQRIADYFTVELPKLYAVERKI